MDDAAVLKQELVSVQKMMDDVTREKVNKSTLFCCVFTCGEARRSMDHNWPLASSFESSQGSLYRPEKHRIIGN